MQRKFLIAIDNNNNNNNNNNNYNKCITNILS